MGSRLRDSASRQIGFWEILLANRESVFREDLFLYICPLALAAFGCRCKFTQPRATFFNISVLRWRYLWRRKCVYACRRRGRTRSTAQQKSAKFHAPFFPHKSTLLSTSIPLSVLLNIECALKQRGSEDAEREEECEGEAEKDGGREAVGEDHDVVVGRDALLLEDGARVILGCYSVVS